MKVSHDLPAELELWWLDLDTTEAVPGTSALAGAGMPTPARRRRVAKLVLLDLLSHRLGRPVEDSSIVTDRGVDLEVSRPVPESEAFASEYLTVSELDTWIRLPVVERDRWLLGCWTRKEACLKALGVGLRLAPASIPAGAGPELKRISLGDGEADHTLLVTSLELPSGSPGAAAIAVEGP